MDAAQRKQLSSMRRLLKSVEYSDVTQGVALALSLDDPEILTALTAGLALVDGRLVLESTSEIRKRVRPDHRANVALALARAAGLLDGVSDLDLSREGREALSDLRPLAGLTALRSLSLARCVHLADLGPLAELPGLAALDLSKCTGLGPGALAPLAGLTGLTELNLRDVWKIKSLEALAGLTGLTELDLQGCVNLEDLSTIAGFVGLERLNLNNTCSRSWDVPNDFSPLAGLERLERLEICGWHQVDLGPLTRLTALRQLRFQGSSNQEDLSPIGRLTGLTHLDLSARQYLMDLRPLAGLTQLQVLDLSYDFRITDLSPLAGLTSLTHLRLEQCNGIEDLSPLAGIAGLQVLYLRNCRKLKGRRALKPLDRIQGLAIDRSARDEWDSSLF